MLTRFEYENASFSIVRSSEFGSNSTRVSCWQNEKASSLIFVMCDGIRMLASAEHENACGPMILIADGIFTSTESRVMKTKVS